MDTAIVDVAARPAAESTRTLPGWTYDNAAFFELEKRHLFLANWQPVCHESELAGAGAFATLDFLGERAFVIRGEDGALRAFNNVCRHRAHAVVAGQGGHCNGLIRCPYHGWAYGFDGSLKAVPGESGFPGLDKGDFGLHPLDLEVFLGFAFVRFRPGGPSVAERFAPFRAEMARYRFDVMRPYGAPWAIETGVDWKNVMDNYLEGYHVPVGHPGLYRLFGAHYEVETRPGGVSRALHWLRNKPSSNWSERHYQKLLPDMAHLPEDRKRAWAYYALLPNLALETFPDHMDYFHVVPTGPGRCRIRGRSFRLPDDRRALRAAQWLNRRINDQVQREDNGLIASVQAGLATSCYGAGVLSEKEIGLCQLHEMVREALPVARLATPPAPGAISAANDSLRA